MRDTYEVLPEAVNRTRMPARHEAGKGTPAEEDRKDRSAPSPARVLTGMKQFSAPT